MTVPFSPEELVARVLQLGDLEIDILNRLARVHGKHRHLSGIK